MRILGKEVGSIHKKVIRFVKQAMISVGSVVLTKYLGESDDGREKLFYLSIGGHVFLYPSALIPTMLWFASGVIQVTMKTHVGQATFLCRDPPKVKPH